MMGDFSALERGGGGEFGRSRRPGDELGDDCKLYVGGVPNVYDDAMLRSLFDPHGNVLHAGACVRACACARVHGGWGGGGQHSAASMPLHVQQEGAAVFRVLTHLWLVSGQD